MQMDGRNPRTVASIIAVVALALPAMFTTTAVPAQAGQGSQGHPRLKGSGYFAGTGAMEEKVHFRAQLACSQSSEDGPAVFEFHWGGNTFSLDRMEQAGCSNNLDDRGEPVSSSHEGSGVGTCNEEGGLMIDWKLTDGGQGNSGRDGRGDEVGIIVIGGSEACNLSFDGPLGGGNIKMYGDSDQ